MTENKKSRNNNDKQTLREVDQHTQSGKNHKLSVQAPHIPGQASGMNIRSVRWCHLNQNGNDKANTYNQFLLIYNIDSINNLRVVQT